MYVKEKPLCGGSLGESMGTRIYPENQQELICQYALCKRYINNWGKQGGFWLHHRDNCVPDRFLFRDEKVTILLEIALSAGVNYFEMFWSANEYLILIEFN